MPPTKNFETVNKFNKVSEGLKSSDPKTIEATLNELEKFYPAKNVGKFLNYLQKNYGEFHAVSFVSDLEKGTTETISYAELYEKTQNLAKKLLDWGIKKGDRVGMITENSPEQLIFNLACQSIGAVVLPWTVNVKKNKGKTHSEIMQEAKMDFVAIADEKLITELLPNFKILPISEKLENQEYFAKNLPKPQQKSTNEDWQNAIENVKSTDPALLMFSSGTGGDNPKLSQHSHRNLMYTTFAAQTSSNMHQKEKILEVLPWHHIYQYLTQFIALSTGQELYISTIEELTKSELKILKVIAPNYVTGVPLIWNKLSRNIKKRLEKEINSKPKNLKKYIKKLITKATVNALKKNSAKYVLEEIKKVLPEHFEISRKYWTQMPEDAKEILITLRKSLRKRIGMLIGELIGIPLLKKELGLNNISYIVNGGGALPPNVADFYSALKVPMNSGYGTTEVCIFAFNAGKKEKDINPPYHSGKILPGCHFEFNENNDYPGYPTLKIISPAIAEKIYDPTSGKIIYPQNTFMTGDLGTVTKEGQNDFQLTVTGRVGSLIKLQQGKAILPNPIEDHLTNNLPYLERAFIHGTDKDRTLTALVFVEKGNNKTTEEISKEVKDLIANENFGATIGKVVVETNPLDPACISRSEKLIRPAVVEKYLN